MDVDEFGTRVATAGDFSRPIITASLPLISYTALEFKHGPWAGIRAAHRFDADGAVLLLSIDNSPDPTERAARFEQLFTTLALDGIVVNRTNSCGFMIASKKYQIRTTVAQLGGLNPSAITIGGLADPAQYAIFLQTQEDMGVLTRMITLTKDTYQNARSSIQEKTAWVIRFFGMAPASCPVLRPCAEFSWKDGKFLQIDEDLPAQQLIVYANFSL